MMDEPTEPEESRNDSVTTTTPARWQVVAVIAPLVLLTIGNYVASAILFTLIKRHPGWLVALNPTTRNLILVASEMPAFFYYALAIPRRMLPHPLWFLIGRWYGQRGIKLVQKYSPDTAALVATLEEYFPRFGWLILILYPNPVVCAMAGASAMNFWIFFACALAGVIGFVVVSRVFGDVLHPVTSSIANFGQHYWIPLTILTVAIVLIGIVQGIRRG